MKLTVPHGVHKKKINISAKDPRTTEENSQKSEF